MCFIYLGGLGRIIHTNVALSVYKLPFVLYCMSLGYVGIVAFQFKRLCYLREKDITRDGDVEWDIPHRLHAHNRGMNSTSVHRFSLTLEDFWAISHRDSWVTTENLHHMHNSRSNFKRTGVRRMISPEPCRAFEENIILLLSPGAIIFGQDIVAKSVALVWPLKLPTSRL